MKWSEVEGNGWDIQVSSLEREIGVVRGSFGKVYLFIGEVEGSHFEVEG
jgi:hypothetical protein